MRPSLETTIRQSAFRRCHNPDCTRRVYGGGLYCSQCYSVTPAGKAERVRETTRSTYRRKEQERERTGQPLPEIHCSRCVHWLEEECSLGFPEGLGSFAEDCSCFTVTAIDLEAEALHPDIQDTVQGRLETAYHLAGRDDKNHPFHSLYTNVFGELETRGISI